VRLPFCNEGDLIFAKFSRRQLGELSITGIRRLLLRFERAVNKTRINGLNILMTHRVSTEVLAVNHITDSPSRFIDSEADLDAALKALLPLAQAPVLAYPELVRSGTITC